MSSSTSSSETESASHQLSNKPWPRVGLLTLVLAGGIVGGAEAFWRGQGQLPWVPDSKELWAFHRSRVYNDRKTVLLLGTSRMGAAISPEMFRARCPDYQLVQLSLTGSNSPIGMLEHFAVDDDFSGIVLCGMAAPFLDRTRWEDQSEHYNYPSKPHERWSAAVHGYLRASIVVLDPGLSLKTTIKNHLQSAPLPEPDHRWRTFDRFLYFDFEKDPEMESRRKRRVEQVRREYEEVKTPTGDELRSIVAEIDRLVERVRRNGGEVVFIRLPSSGKRLQVEEEYYPKAEHWDRFARASSAICIHFQDIPSQSQFVCPDESHLDYRDASRFTNALIDELTRRNVIGAR